MLTTNQELIQTALSLDKFNQALSRRAKDLTEQAFDTLSEKLLTYINTIAMTGVILDENPEPGTYSIRLAEARNLTTSISIIHGKCVMIESALIQYSKISSRAYKSKKNSLYLTDSDVKKEKSVSSKNAVVEAKLSDEVSRLEYLEALLEMISKARKLCESKMGALNGTIFDLKAQIDKFEDLDDNGVSIPVEDVDDVEDYSWANNL